MAIRTKTATFARPADTTAYAANDVVANSSTSNAASAMAFPLVRGTIKRVVVAKSTNTTTNSAMRLLLFASDPSGALTDNAALAMANPRSDLLANIPIATFAVPTGTPIGYAVSDNDLTSAPTTIVPPVVDVAFGQAGSGNLMSRDATIYGVLTATAAYAPGNGEIFSVQLHVEPDNP